MIGMVLKNEEAGQAGCREPAVPGADSADCAACSGDTMTIKSRVGGVSEFLSKLHICIALFTKGST